MRLKRSRTSSITLYKRLALAVPSVLPMILLFLFGLLVYQLFTIRQIKCSLNDTPCPVELLDKINKYLGSNMLFLNQKELTASLKASFPIEKTNLGFQMFNTLAVKVEGRLTSINTQLSLEKTLPVLSFDGREGSTESAIFQKPSEEISHSTQSIEYLNFEIWDNGLMSPAASSDSKIKYLFTTKPDTSAVRSVYSVIKLLEKYLEVDQIWILNARVFLRRSGQPDIIVGVPFDEDSLVQALQSLAYLTTIKKDAKVIDLRFKNPIIR